MAMEMIYNKKIKRQPPVLGIFHNSSWVNYGIEKNVGHLILVIN